jgi:hypothetical protein
MKQSQIGTPAPVQTVRKDDSGKHYYVPVVTKKWQCNKCGAEFTAYEQCLDHRDATGHHDFTLYKNGMKTAWATW